MRIVLIALVPLVLAGCTPGVDLDAERRALRQADIDFAKDTAARGSEGWASWFAEDGIMLPRQGRVDGRDAIRERMRAAFDEGGFRLAWHPITAEVGSGGDLGYTLGRFEGFVPDASGKDSLVSKGHYVSIWRKTPDEGWRVALDIGNTDEE